MYSNVCMLDYYKYDVIDLNSGMRIPFVQEADDETGYFTIILPDYDRSNEEIRFVEFFNPISQEWDTVKFKFQGNIKIIKKEVEINDNCINS